VLDGGGGDLHGWQRGQGSGKELMEWKTETGNRGSVVENANTKSLISW